jgi:hypothetical protein
MVNVVLVVRRHVVHLETRHLGRTTKLQKSATNFRTSTFLVLYKMNFDVGIVLKLRDGVVMVECVMMSLEHGV